MDDERDLDPLAVGREHDARGADLHVHVALVVIKGAQHQHVALEEILAVRTSGAEREERALAGLHDLAELGLRHVHVPDERDAPHGHRLVLDDLELDDDLVVPLGDDLEIDLGEEVALLLVGVLDLLDAAADGRDAQDGVGLDLDGLVELLLVELRVAFVFDGFDVGPLADEEAQRDAAVAAGEIGLDVVEEAGVPEGVHVARERAHREGLADLLLEVREDLVLRRPAVAADVDGDDGAPFGLLPLGGGEADLGGGELGGGLRRVAGVRVVRRRGGDAAVSGWGRGPCVGRGERRGGRRARAGVCGRGTRGLGERRRPEREGRERRQRQKQRDEQAAQGEGPSLGVRARHGGADGG